jgi:hypothetical protein
MGASVVSYCPSSSSLTPCPVPRADFPPFFSSFFTGGANDIIPRTSLPDEACTMTCNDDSTHTCGGANAVDVYQAVNFVPPVLPPVVVPTTPTPPGKLTGNADFTCASFTSSARQLLRFLPLLPFLSFALPIPLFCSILGIPTDNSS